MDILFNGSILFFNMRNKNCICFDLNIIVSPMKIMLKVIIFFDIAYITVFFYIYLLRY